MSSTVDVMIPVLNEVETIDRTLKSIRQQTRWPETVWVADGGSHDGTLERLEEWTDRLPLEILENPRKRQAPGLNRIIGESDANYLARLDGHTSWSENYLETLCEALDENPNRVAAGGLVERDPETNRFQENVWSFMTHVLGTGGPAYRTQDQRAGAVETVQSPVYRRRALEEAGLFREDLPWAEDDELHRRLRRDGDTLWLEPEARIRYRPRNNYRDVLVQMNHYGQGRGKLGREGIFPTKRHQMIDRLLIVWTFGMVWNPIGWGLALFYAFFLPVLVFHEWMEKRGGLPLLLLFPGGQLAYWLGWLQGRFSPKPLKPGEPQSSRRNPNQ